MNAKLYTPPKFSGPLSECLERARPEDATEFERRWYRGQMRGWAGHWRRAAAEAALLGKPVKEVANTALYLAKVYRDGSMKGGAR